MKWKSLVCWKRLRPVGMAVLEFYIPVLTVGAGEELRGPPFTNLRISGAPSFAPLRRVGCKPLAPPALDYSPASKLRPHAAAALPSTAHPRTDAPADAAGSGRHPAAARPGSIPRKPRSAQADPRSHPPAPEAPRAESPAAARYSGASPPHPRRGCTRPP